MNFFKESKSKFFFVGGRGGGLARERGFFSFTTNPNLKQLFLGWGGGRRRG